MPADELVIEDPGVVAALFDPLRYRLFRLLETPRKVRAGDAEATLTPQRLRALVRTGRVDGGLAVSLDPKGLGASPSPVSQ